MDGDVEAADLSGPSPPPQEVLRSQLRNDGQTFDQLSQHAVPGARRTKGQLLLSSARFVTWVLSPGLHNWAQPVSVER